MIELTRLNNTRFLVNADLIKFVEESPDTLVTLTTGEKIVVRERSSDVLVRVIKFRRRVLAGLWDPSLQDSPLSRSSNSETNKP
jgi:flagellar protein FlbD